VTKAGVFVGLFCPFLVILFVLGSCLKLFVSFSCNGARVAGSDSSGVLRDS
jgi:hypothetical protein